MPRFPLDLSEILVRRLLAREIEAGTSEIVFQARHCGSDMMRRAGRYDHVVLGFPGAFTLWAFDAIRLLAKRSEGREVRQIERTDELVGGGSGAAIYLTQYPSASVIDAVANGDLQAYVLVEDPIDVMRYLMGRGNTRHQAVRALSASSVAAFAVAAAPHAEIVGCIGDQPMHTYLHHMAACLGLHHDDATIESVRAELTAKQPHARSLAAGISSRIAGSEAVYGAAPLDDDTSALVASIITPLALIMQDGTFRSIAWPTRVFFAGDRLDQPAASVEAVTGPARTLFYGPYFHLPPADYRVEIILAFSGRIEDIPFLLEIHGKDCRARARIEPRTSGSYRGSFSLQHRDPIDALEIRLRNERGAIEGSVALVEMRFIPERAHFNPPS